MEEVQITKQALALFAEEAMKTDNEIVAFGLASIKEGIVIDKIKFCQNVSPHPTVEYMLSQKDFGEFLKYHRGKEEQKLISVIHSHPRFRAYASSVDISKMYPNYAYIIFSCVENLARAFTKLPNGSVVEIKLLVI